MHPSEKSLFLAPFPWISANSNKNSRRYNFRTFANISRNFQKYWISGKFTTPSPEWCNNSESNRILLSAESPSSSGNSVGQTGYTDFKSSCAAVTMLWFVPPWLTFRQTDRHADNIWPAHTNRPRSVINWSKKFTLAAQSFPVHVHYTNCTNRVRLSHSLIQWKVSLPRLLLPLHWSPPSFLPTAAVSGWWCPAYHFVNKWLWDILENRYNGTCHSFSDRDNM